jgi:hypothetical protein
MAAVQVNVNRDWGARVRSSNDECCRSFGCVRTVGNCNLYRSPLIFSRPTPMDGQQYV